MTDDPGTSAPRGNQASVNAPQSSLVSHGQVLAEQFWRIVGGLGRTSVGFLVIGIVPLFLVFANTQIKELVDRFIGGCVLVVDKHATANGQIQVTGRIAGTMPSTIPLMFAGRDALINTILFDDAYRQERIREPDDLAFHPMTGMTCPGALCEDSGSAVFRPQVQIILSDLRGEFAYRFNVRVKLDPGQSNVREEHLKVYALYDKGLDGGVCRVQPRRWFNFWVWATPLQKAILFMSLLIICGLMVKWAKSSGATT